MNAEKLVCFILNTAQLDSMLHHNERRICVHLFSCTAMGMQRESRGSFRAVEIILENQQCYLADNNLVSLIAVNTTSSLHASTDTHIWIIYPFIPCD